jgi:eukaryotic-like serine/threonine-protein kinase
MTDTRPPAADLPTPPDDPRVVRALERYLAEFEAGRTPDRAALLAEYADVAGPLAECLDGLDFLRDAGGPAADLPPAAVGRIDQLGDFRLIREIGRGGMGVVYEAEQVSLGRRVAVKTLPAAAGVSPADLRRFRHEARAAALLAHPHVVPVYTVGCDRGVHYLAMRLIPGRSLAELIDRPEADSTLPYVAGRRCRTARGSPPGWPSRRPTPWPTPTRPGSSTGT